VGWVVSLLSPEPEASSRYAEVKHRMHVGAEAEPSPAPGAPPEAGPVSTPGPQAH
jgi:cation/acetate symporter